MISAFLRRKKVVAVSLCLLVGLILSLYAFRADAVLVFWRATHLLPNVVLAQNKVPEVALEIASYYFPEGSGKVEKYDREMAKRFYTAALMLDQSAPRAWFQLARIAFIDGEFERSLQYLDKQHAETGDELYSVYYVRGLAYGFLENKTDEAIESFEKYLFFDEGGWYTYNDLAWLYFQKGDFQNVKEMADRGLNYNPGNPWLLMTKGVALMNLGEFLEANEYLSVAREEAKKLTLEDWGRAYPGNDPRHYAAGLREFKETIEKNIALVDKEL